MICRANQLNDFYIMTTLVLNELKVATFDVEICTSKNLEFFYYYLTNTAKNTLIFSKSWCQNFVERNSFRMVYAV